MIPAVSTQTTPYAVGAKVKVTQMVRVGGISWSTSVVGTVVRDGVRPIGGMEMGMKAACGFQPTLILQGLDGELTTVTLDECTDIQILGS